MIAANHNPIDPTAEGACPDSRYWLKVVAGHADPTHTDALLAHAAACARCSAHLRAHLRECSALLDDAITPEEELLLNDMKLSQPAARAQLAQLLADPQFSNRQPARHTTPRLRWPWWLTLRVPQGFAVAGVLVLLSAWAVYVTAFRGHDARLLAEAYDTQRLTALRIPGGRDVEIASATRGAATSVSASLLRVKLLAQQALEKDPADPAAHQRVGRVAIVEHDSATAVREFEFAQAFAPSLPGIHFDLGTAYFIRAESAASALGYARAADQFSQQLSLARKPDAVLLYDRALCWERVGALQQAIADYKQALAAESDDAWRKDIQQHLTRLQDRGDSGMGASETPLTPSAFLALAQQPEGLYESVSATAIRLWLPHRQADASTGPALLRLAAWGRTHGDSWWQDLRRQPPTEELQHQESLLASTIDANLSGAVNTALADSSAAATTAGAALPLTLRFAVEHLHAQSRSGHSAQCIAEADLLARKLEKTSYEQLKLTVQLERASCDLVTGQNETAAVRLREVDAQANEHGLPDAAARAAVFLMEQQTVDGQLQAAFATGADSLQRGTVSALRRYQLLSNLSVLTDRLGLQWARQGLCEDAARSADITGNLRVAAYAHEYLAESELHTGSTAAALNFSRADAAARQLHDPQLAELYAADWESARAGAPVRPQALDVMRLDVLRLDVLRLDVLRKDERSMLALHMLEPKITFYDTFASALLERGRADEAFDKATTAVRLADTALAKLHGHRIREGWIREHGQAYRVLIACQLAQHQSTAALETWRHMRTLPYLSDTLPELPARSADAAARHHLQLTYARIGNRYAAWARIPGAPAAVRQLWVAPDAESVERLSGIFMRLCADPALPAAELEAAGRQLAVWLLTPFAAEIQAAETIDLDTDDALTTLPFTALMLDGHPLGLQRKLAYLEPSFAPATPAPATTSSASASWLLLHSPNQADPDQAGPDQTGPDQTGPDQASGDHAGPARIAAAYDEAAELASSRPGAHQQSAALAVQAGAVGFRADMDLQRRLRTAQYIHYSGHGLTEQPTTGTPVAPGTPAAHSFTPLQPGALAGCRLAVLAACRTRGQRVRDADDVTSIGRETLDAGAATVVATQWDVDSRATRQLMLAFYAALDKGMDPEQALRIAQQGIGRSSQTSHPFYWAAFQVLHRYND